jgi:LPS sulfotransferase NodH
MNSDLIFIIGRQRSGTTVFRSLLANHGALDANEIMHEDISERHRFYRYVSARARENPELIHPNKHQKLFGEFIENLRSEAEGRKIAIDLKYSALNAIPTMGKFKFHRPFLVRYLYESEVNLVHIVRKNKLRIHVSALIARATGKWGAGSLDQLPANRPLLALNIRQTLKKLEELEEEEKVVTNMIAFLPGIKQLLYETMFDANGNFSSSTIECAKQLLNRNEIDPVPSKIQMNPENLSLLVKNYDELAKCLNQTPYAWMIND